MGKTKIPILPNADDIALVTDKETDVIGVGDEVSLFIHPYQNYCHFFQYSRKLCNNFQGLI